MKILVKYKEIKKLFKIKEKIFTNLFSDGYVIESDGAMFHRDIHIESDEWKDENDNHWLGDRKTNKYYELTPCTGFGCEIKKHYPNVRHMNAK